MGQPLKLKIVSDGTTDGTAIYDVATGEAINNVVGVEWSVSIGNPLAVCRIEFVDVQVEVVERREDP